MTDRADGRVGRAPLAVAVAIAGEDGAGLQDVVQQLAGPAGGAARLWSVLDHGGLLPATACAVEQAGLGDRLDARTRAALRSAYEVNAIRQARFRRLALDVSRRLGEAGIRTLWAKGLWMAHHAYPEPAQRVMADADLFVPPGRRAEATDALRAVGFELDPVVDAAGLEVFADALRPPAGHRAGPDLSVDIHDTLQLSPGRRWPVERLWRGAAPVRPGGVEVWVPSPAAALALTAVHAMKHGLDLRHLVIGVADTVAVLRRFGDRSWVQDVEPLVDDGFDAAALYVLLSAAGPALPTSGRHLLAFATAAADRQGVRARADRLLRAARRAPFMRDQDFSLFAVGERGGPAAVGRLLAGGLRWRRRVAFADARAGRRRGSVLARLRTANWRLAWSTYLAGRLSGRVRR